MNVTIIEKNESSSAARRGFLQTVREMRRLLKREWPSAWVATKPPFFTEDSDIFFKAKVKNFIVTIDARAASRGISFSGHGGCAAHLSMSIPFEGDCTITDKIGAAFELLDIGEELAQMPVGTGTCEHDEIAQIVSHALMSINGRVTVRQPTPWTKGKVFARVRVPRHGLSTPLGITGVPTQIPGIDGTADVTAEVRQRLQHFSALVQPDLKPTLSCLYENHSGGGFKLKASVVEASREGQAQLNPMDALRAYNRWHSSLTASGLA